MGLQAQNLAIIFRSIQPEQLYQSIQQRTAHISGQSTFSSEYISEDLFQSLAQGQYPTYSHEEIGNIFHILQQQMNSPDAQANNRCSVFYLLVRMGQRALQWNGHGPICRFSEVFSWRNAYQNLGQDIITTAYTAYEDLQRNNFHRYEFDWPPALKTDNIRLNRLFGRGLAENHCHLGGTTQNFPVSWACLMNHVEEIEHLSEWLKINLQVNISRGVSGNVWTWKERLLWAAWLRINLFEFLQKIEAQEHLSREEEWAGKQELDFDLKY